MISIADSFKGVREHIKLASEAAQRPVEQINLLAVSKTRSVEEVKELALLGQTAFGENYLQEALEKIEALKSFNLEWHFIGPIQSNKTRPIAENFNWVHSVDRLKIAQRLSDQRPAELEPINLCLQVNISREESKAGCLPEEAVELALAISTLPNIRLRGLMAIPEATDDPDIQRQRFSDVQALQHVINAQGGQLDTLSMGMSGDLDAAIAEGATIVRVGTALFGPRNYNQS